MRDVYRYPGMHPAKGPHVPICMDCGSPHAPERRRIIIRRLLPATTADLADAYPCLLGHTNTSIREFEKMGATRDDDGVWSLT